MKTISFLPGRINKLYSFTLAVILALLLPICLMAAQPREVTSLPAEDLKQFAGTYRLIGNPGLALEISTAGTGLTLKEMWSNREISFKQTATLNFIAAEHPDFTLDFARSKSGGINHVTAFKKDVWIRVNPDAAGKKLNAAEATQTYQKIFNAFQETVNTNDTEKIQSFLNTYMAENTLMAISLDNLTMRTKEMYQETGGIILDTSKAINPITGTATFKSKKGNQFQLSFTLNSDGKITNFGLQE